ncbi:hypothetical protein [uncultured Mitsuokella sp.]|uniref:hypothetical protein n=1 Tax=uncultured Mitsuokella sp. TaxID=453120 RepID=UPI0025994AFF|nr:hypothetical protein [uncultured Mitsuokella sp.]
MIPIAKYDNEGRCIKAGMSLRPVKRTLGRAKKALTPSEKTQSRIEWTVAGIVMLLGTIVAVEVLAAIAAVMM